MADPRDAALAVVTGCEVATLATAGPEGPWASPVFYAPDGFDLIFVSSPRSRHARHLAADPRCSAAVHPPPDDWRTITGVQMAGRVHELGGADEAASVARYLRRFPFADPRRAPEMIRRALAGISWYRFVAEAVYLVDNRRGFGRIEV